MLVREHVAISTWHLAKPKANLTADVADEWINTDLTTARENRDERQKPFNAE